MAPLALENLQPSFDGLLESADKDTFIAIVEEEEEVIQAAAGTADGKTAAARKRRRESHSSTCTTSSTLEGHWVVLYACSPFLRNKLERWSCGETPKTQAHLAEQHQSGRHTAYKYSIQLLVPSGQLDLGKRLITAMYSSSPDLSDLSPQQLVQLALLADCYAVGCVAAAVGHSLSSRSSAGGMSLDTAAAVFSLPDGCQQLQAFAGARQAAAEVLQQELGDLEVAWGDQDKQRALLALPFDALLALLRDKRTRVASEDTVVYTTGRWVRQHRGEVSKQQQRQLAATFNLDRCTPSFQDFVALQPDSWDSQEGWSWKPPFHRDVRWELDVPTALAARRWAWLQRAYDAKASSQLPRRPASSITAVELQWKVTLPQLVQTYLDGCAGDGRYQLLSPEPGVVYHGREWRLGIYMTYMWAEPVLVTEDEGAECEAVCSIHTTKGEVLSYHPMEDYPTATMDGERCGTNFFGMMGGGLGAAAQGA